MIASVRPVRAAGDAALAEPELIANLAALLEWLRGAGLSCADSAYQSALQAAQQIALGAANTGAELSELASAIHTCMAGLPSASRMHASLAREVMSNSLEYLIRIAAEPLPRHAALAASAPERAALTNAVRAATVNAPAHQAESASRTVPSSGTAAAAPFIDLFRLECEERTAALGTGLVALEGLAPTERAARELCLRDLMRAAHSLKGAAAIAGLPSLSSLAHHMEDQLLAWSETCAVAASDVDTLLDAVDLFGNAAASIADHGHVQASIEIQASTLETRLRAREPASSVTSTTSTTSTTSVALSRAPAAAALAPLERGEKRGVRIATENLDRLAGLAGESLVESRRVGTLAQQAQRVRRRQSRLKELLLACKQVSGEDPTGTLQALLTSAIAESAACGAELAEHAESLDRHVQRTEALGERLYRESLQSRMRPFVDATRGFPRVVRDLARQLDKSARFELEGQDTKVDREVLEGLDAPLNHLLRNALDHGIESAAERRACGKPELALIRMAAHHHAGTLVIAVRDDGRGIDLARVRAKVVERGLATETLAASLTDPELLDFLFLPGFSTARQVSDISGRGVGLDVVKSAIEALGGNVRVESLLGNGATFHLRLPVTRSVVRAVTAEVGGELYAFPLHRIDRIDRIETSALSVVEGTPCFLFDGDPVSVVSARRLLGLPFGPAVTTLPVVMVSDRGQRFAISVDALCGEQDLVVRPLDARLGKVQDIAATATLEDGTPALIVDVDDLLRSVERATGPQAVGEARLALVSTAARKRVLVVDDSFTVREAERQMLAQRGYAVDVAVDGIDGLNAMRRAQYDLIVTDIDMPRLNGFELIRSMRKDTKLQAVPVIIVSYKDRDEDRKLGLEVGASYFLTKASFHDESLLQAVQDLIGDAL